MRISEAPAKYALQRAKRAGYRRFGQYQLSRAPFLPGRRQKIQIPALLPGEILPVFAEDSYGSRVNCGGEPE